MYDALPNASPLPWSALALPIAAAEDSLARLDERLAKSPIRDGWIARTHFIDASASLWLQGELVHIEDLVLHDAGMDVRTPTHELNRAHTVLRTRRRMLAGAPGWALSPLGLQDLCGRSAGDNATEMPRATQQGRGAANADADDANADASEDRAIAGHDDPRLAQALAAVDAAMAQTDRHLANAAAQYAIERDPLIYDLDWDEAARLSEWQRITAATQSLPPTLAAAIVLAAFDDIAPLQHLPWMGRLLAAALLRARGKTRVHLACLNLGLRAIPREQRRARSGPDRLVAILDAMTAGADAGLKDHDRWLNARAVLARKLDGRRSTSKLPTLIDYVLSRPMVSAGMIAAALGVTPRAALDLVAQLGLRETTGRGRYRAWGVL
ncbi:RHE_PE00001 family protein [Methylovirgula sp. HY1]|uniref:RHE_PE00001 family protein n=1 Tax=Methylovirgula sp. HY1 TaxID=2822761 RepID=UPI001C5B479E|nr:RHE_PE00001 family protein [Methylovirgula sp. HY1]QXX76643.1 hypothetical protein MHY1_p00165 [Methylovirgula sp. HY1]